MNKRIKILKAFLKNTKSQIAFIVLCVLNMVFFMISMGIMMIPYVGVILAAFFMMTFMKLFNSYSVGLLYSDAYKISKTQEDIKEIPKAENISEESDVLDEYEEISKDKKKDTERIQNRRLSVSFFF